MSSKNYKQKTILAGKGIVSEVDVYLLEVFVEVTGKKAKGRRAVKLQS